MKAGADRVRITLAVDYILDFIKTHTHILNIVNTRIQNG